MSVLIIVLVMPLLSSHIWCLRQLTNSDLGCSDHHLPNSALYLSICKFIWDTQKNFYCYVNEKKEEDVGLSKNENRLEIRYDSSNASSVIHIKSKYVTAIPTYVQ